MVVPPGHHRGSDLRGTCQYVARRACPEPVGGRPEDARLPARQVGAKPKAGWSAAQSASGASTFLGPQKGLPGFPPEPRRKVLPLSPLSMLRLCAFAEQTIPASRHPTRTYRSERMTAISAVAADGLCIMRARRELSSDAEIQSLGTGDRPGNSNQDDRPLRRVRRLLEGEEGKVRGKSFKDTPDGRCGRPPRRSLHYAGHRGRPRWSFSDGSL